MDINILEFAENKGKEIAKNISEKYDQADFDLSQNKIEKEIYNISFNYASIFFFENSKMALSKKMRDDLIFKVRSFIAEKINLDKEGNNKLLTEVIKFYVIQYLLSDYNIFIA